ncbi:MAG: Asp-tRNA(Asn)/Glu-tRNA(Gln) amidotransferase subunit GatA [Bdellovibrionaceae bacterium]|nr:Asp-tRNA(Asn)/Glu-tRNA(Gln) amidotransferase subunit GatA [Pseudobdellovibrionaceae bacterium]MDW8190278.1 Asp-tRNA(Asn)/Glu-tRNA(Gln) amidotransferase subunit GatA [Pseudobdellovibrionaceae bacterium]
MLDTGTTLSDVIRLIKERVVKVSEVTQFYLERATRLNPSINAFITVNDAVLDQAQKMDDQLPNQEQWEKQPLWGVPLGIKDMFCTKGLRTTAASRMLAQFVPPYDATVVSRLKQAGALILGKLNQDEFAMGSSTETSYFGQCRNPWHLEYVPGGSSGGSAAAVAASMCPAALGTDTGGSIRQPAHFCGIVGIKPTYGRVSRFGIVAFASSLDQAGPMTKTVEDAARILEVISGLDIKDQTTSSEKVPSWSNNLNPNVRGLRVGVLQEFMDKSSLNIDVARALEEVEAFLRKEGASLVPISLPLVKHGVSVYYLIASSEASSNLARYDGVRYGHRAQFDHFSGVTLERFYSRNRSEGFGAEVKSRIMLGTYCLSAGYYDAYYKKASQVRRLLRDDFLKAFQQCDVILSPVSTTPAFRLGERLHDPLQMYLNDICTVSVNLAGLCGISVPVTLSSQGLPIGVQFIGKPFDEQSLFNCGFALEKAFAFYRRFKNELPRL